ncbi:MAG: hypothetical protein LUP96_07425 [Methylococcaceae bacterium]|nr:hypothetical protein [Methylococcaceae bacterium]
MQTQFFAYLCTIWCQNKKTVSFIVALLILLLFGDTLLPLIGHCLHLLIEVVESVLEHFLEAAFGLSARQAQLVLFYSAFAIAAYLSWYFVRKAYFTVRHLVQTHWRSIKTSPWFKPLLMFGALGATIYIFS